MRDGLQVRRIDGGSASEDAKAAAVSAMRDKIAALRVERALNLTVDEQGQMADELTLVTAVCEAVQAASHELESEPPAPSEDAPTVQKSSVHRAARRNKPS